MSSETTLRRPWLWSLFAAVILSVPVAAALRARAHPALPVLGEVPAFTLTDQTGAPLASADLRGKVWVADFVFTHCREMCPRLTGEMAQLVPYLRNRALADRVRLISISVDPVNDTPAQLAAYAAEFHADPSLWKFLTGSSHDVEDAVVRGFKIGVDREKDDRYAGGFNVIHGTRLVLIDARGRIRGYYDIDEATQMQRLRADIAQLAQ